MTLDLLMAGMGLDVVFDERKKGGKGDKLTIWITHAAPKPPMIWIPLIIGFPVSTLKVEKRPLAIAVNAVPKNSQGLKCPNFVTIINH